MTAAADTMGANEAGYELGGTSCDRPGGILNRTGKRESAEILDCKCIAAWRDAAAVGLDADPGALIISSPLQSHRRNSDAPL